MLEKTLESPLDCKEIQPVHPKGDQSWVFIGRTDTEAETRILWPPDAKNWFIGKDPDAGRDWGQEKKGMTEDEMAGWHHQLDGHEFGWTPGGGDGQGGLACCDSWGRKESDTTERLNWTEWDNTGRKWARSKMAWILDSSSPFQLFIKQIFNKHLSCVRYLLDFRYALMGEIVTGFVCPVEDKDIKQSQK